MKQTTLLLIPIFLLAACKQKEIQEINFSTDYKFNSEIEENLMNDTIPGRYQIAASEYAKREITKMP